jgi:hypothetical protein
MKTRPVKSKLCLYGFLTMKSKQMSSVNVVAFNYGLFLHFISFSGFDVDGVHMSTQSPGAVLSLGV